MKLKMSGSEMTSSTGIFASEKPQRRALKVAVCALCSEVGFSLADDAVIETLTEMLQSFITELGRSSKAFCELSGRTDPLVSDVSVALIEMGQNITQLRSYAKKHQTPLTFSNTSAQSSEIKRLQVGSPEPHPSYIQDYFPPFPDSHTYIKSLTHKAPVTDYQVIREKVAAQKRDVERALTRFIAKTGDTENLFPDDPYAFPLIANKPKQTPYLDALLPKDQDAQQLDEDEKWSMQNREIESEGKMSESQKLERFSCSGLGAQSHIIKSDVAPNPAPIGSLDLLDSDSLIDNPYLRPIKMPKLKGSAKKNKF